MNFYIHHINDWAEATNHLSFVEEAAYGRLIRKYYATEKPLPADIKVVQRLVSAQTKAELVAVKSVLEEFFTLYTDGWHNKRCDEEIALYREKQEKAKRSANARWNKQQPQCESDANALPEDRRLHTKTHTEGNANQKPITRITQRARR